MSAKPVIVIDFDDTLTAIPNFWREVIQLARNYDQRVICMTQRFQDEQNVDDVDEWMDDNGFTIAVYFTNGASKVQYIEEVLKLEKYWLCDNDPRRAVNGV